MCGFVKVSNYGNPNEDILLFIRMRYDCFYACELSVYKTVFIFKRNSLWKLVGQKRNLCLLIKNDEKMLERSSKKQQNSALNQLSSYIWAYDFNYYFAKEISTLKSLPCGKMKT